MISGKISRWLRRSLWAFMDQGLFAASNFLLNVLLARWLPEAGYGDFSVAFTVFLFLGVIYSSVMVEPMFVMGPGRYEGMFQGYLAALRNLHWRSISWLFSLLGVLISIFYLGSGVFISLAVFSLCAPVIFEQWLLRRACYIHAGPWVAAVGGMWYCAVMIGGVFALNYTENLSPVAGILVVGFASVLASFWIRGRLSPRGVERIAHVSAREVKNVHWRYGRWSVASNVVGWLPGNIYLLLLPLWHGSEAAGAFRAASNLGLPILQAQAVAAMLVLPSLVRSRARADYRRQVLGISALLAGGSAIYVGGVWLGGERLFGWLYDGKFSDQARQVWMFVLPAIPSAAMASLSCGVRAMEAPDKVLRAYLVSLVVCLVVGLPMTYVFGVVGVAWAITLSSTVCAVALYLQLRGLTGGRANPVDISGSPAAVGVDD
jgi:O-antigen/teichoic acid export membrane protein